MMEITAEEHSSRILGGEQEEHLINLFFVLYKTARILDPNNATFTRQSSSFHRALTGLMAIDGSVSIKTVAGRYFVNSRMVRFDDTGISGAMSVVAEWKSVGVGGTEFAEGISRSECEQFFIFMAGIKPGAEDIESLSRRLKENKLTNVTLLSLREANAGIEQISEEVRRRFRAAARSNFFRAMSVVEEITVNSTQAKDINVAKTKRVVHLLIDHILRDESSLMELTAIRNYDDYTYAHSTNVSVYSLTLAARLGMDRPRMAQLGFAALFHDIGKVKLPSDLIRKPDAYDENDWRQMQRHPQLGAKTILRNLKFDAHTARAARVAFEHHINNDFTGYPLLSYKKRPASLFSRIISIVDTFDALSSGRVYIRKSISPDEVLRKMHYQMAAKFDPFLLRLFSDIVGIYPSGSLVLLTTDELALVLTNNESDRARPFVKIIGNREGLLTEPQWVDLSLPEQSDRKIVRLVDPAVHGLDIKDFILSD